MISLAAKHIRKLQFKSSPQEPVRVLLVEDSPKVARIARHMLQAYKGVKFMVTSVGSTERCLHLLSDRTFDLILLDYNFPGEDGISALLRLNRRADIPPVIMLVPEGHDAIGTEAMRSGAYDYFPKGIAHAIHQSLDWDRWEAEAKGLRDELERVRIRDELTGLYTRGFLAELLEMEISRARRYRRDLSFLMLDIDDFKRINEAHGDEVGDSALKQISATILNSVRSTDVGARYKEDEFCVLLTETPLEGARTAAERLRFAIAAHQVTIGVRSMPVTASIGVCAVNLQDGLGADSVFSDAEAALKEAKLAGKNRVSLHLPSVDGDEAEADRKAADTGNGAKSANTETGVVERRRLGWMQCPECSREELDEIPSGRGTWLTCPACGFKKFTKRRPTEGDKEAALVMTQKWTPPDDKTIARIRAMMKSDIEEGEPLEKLIDELVTEDGWPKDSAVNFVDDVRKSERKFSDDKAEQRKRFSMR